MKASKLAWILLESATLASVVAGTVFQNQHAAELAKVLIIVDFALAAVLVPITLLCVVAFSVSGGVPQDLLDTLKPSKALLALKFVQGAEAALIAAYGWTWLALAMVASLLIAIACRGALRSGIKSVTTEAERAKQ